MAQTFYLRDQAERCRRLARDSTDANLRDTLLQLAGEFTARADAEEDKGSDAAAPVWRAGPEEKVDT